MNRTSNIPMSPATTNRMTGVRVRPATTNRMTGVRVRPATTNRMTRVGVGAGSTNRTTRVGVGAGSTNRTTRVGVCAGTPDRVGADQVQRVGVSRVVGVLALAVLLVLGACASAEDEAVSADGGSTSSTSDPDVAEDPVADPAGDANAALLAAALTELVTNDHTFGSGPSPFTSYLIQSSIDPAAGSGTGSDAGSERDLNSDERTAIEAAISAFGSVRWIADPAEYRTDDLTPTIEGSAILGVGEPVIDGDRALVGVSLWCGGLCGTWLTYEIEQIDGAWVVTGIDGPIAIS